MDLDDMLIRVHPGDGLVARAGGSVLALLAPIPNQPSIADELLTLVVDSDGEAAPGRRLAHRVARLVAAAEPADVPSFGLVAEAEDGLVLILHGNTDADVSGPGGHEHLSGRQVATWVDRIVEKSVDVLTVGPSGEPLQTPDSRVRLQAGVVHGGGFSVIPAGLTEASRATPDSLAQEALVAAPFDAVAESEAEVLVQPPPQALVQPASMDAMPADDTELVVARSGRLTMESAPEPALSGAFESSLPEEAGPGEMGDAPPGDEGASEVGGDLVEGAPQPVGVIVFDDGASFSLDGDYVIGREPASDPDVVSGRARPLVVEDPDRSVSRVHAAIGLDGSNVMLSDRGAANGTYIAVPGQEEWVPLLPNKPTTIARGTRVRLGDREFRFDLFPAKQ